eukprot:7876122-Pyramimonas_sp.AAC.1
MAEEINSAHPGAGASLHDGTRRRGPGGEAELRWTREGFGAWALNPPGKERRSASPVRWRP